MSEVGGGLASLSNMNR